MLPVAPLPPSLPLQILEADLVLWSAGQAPVSKAAPKQQPAGVGLPFPTNARGAMQTDATLRALHHQRVFALGDISVRCVGRWVGGWVRRLAGLASGQLLCDVPPLSMCLLPAERGSKAFAPSSPYLTTPSPSFRSACSSGGKKQPALPATAQVAFQQADYVAWNLWASINAKPLLNFRWA